MTNQIDQKEIDDMMRKLKASWGWMIAFGVISLIGGFLCFSNPLAATITADYLAGFFFLVLGIAQILQAFSVREWGGFLWTIAVGLLTLMVGGVLLVNPVEGAASLTVLVAILLFLLGGAKIAYGLSLRPASGWVWVLVSGFLSVLLGIIIFANFPWSAVNVLGLFLGVELTFNGVMLLMAGWSLRGS